MTITPKGFWDDKKEQIKKMSSKITITWNREDGSERAKFDNFDDALVFAEAIEKFTTNKKKKNK